MSNDPESCMVLRFGKRPHFGTQKRKSQLLDLDRRQRQICPFCMAELMVATAATAAQIRRVGAVIKASVCRTAVRVTDEGHHVRSYATGGEHRVEALGRAMVRGAVVPGCQRPAHPADWGSAV